jgi:hypothetical protein
MKEQKSRHTAEAAAAASLLLTLVPMPYLSRITAASFKLSLARSSPSVKYWLTYITKTTLSLEKHHTPGLSYVIDGPWFFTYLIKQARKYGSHISCDSSRLHKNLVVIEEKNEVEQL